MEIDQFQQAIAKYGIVREWRVNSHGRRYAYLKASYEWIVDILLLCPPGIWEDNREVRSELYLQAESIIEIVKDMKLQFVNPPQIKLGGYGEQIEGILEIEVMDLIWNRGRAA